MIGHSTPRGARAAGFDDKQRDSIWWVDDAGKWRFIDPSAEQYAPETAPIGPDERSQRLAFRYFGMIKVLLGARGMGVQWDVRCADPLAFDSVLNYLDNALSGLPVRLRFYYGGWIEEWYDDPAQAMRRMVQVHSYRSVTPMATPVTLRADAQEAERAGGFLGTALDMWSRDLSHGASVSTTLDERGLLRDVVVFRRRRDGKLSYTWAGADSLLLSAYGQDWGARCIGRRHDVDPDHEQAGNPLCQVYENVILDREPRYDLIRSPILRAEREPFWMNYERLLIPCRDRHGVDTVILVCRARREIGIPFMGSLVA